MYTSHAGKNEILLWCNHKPTDQSRKRPSSSSIDSDMDAPKRSRYDKHLDKMTEVEEIEENLREKHSDGLYSEEQLRSWAHLIQMKKHTSYDVPPQ